MPFDFKQAVSKGFGKSFCQARNVNGQISASILVAAVPFQGFGNGFSAGSSITPQTGNPPYALFPTLTGGYDSSDKSYTYQKLEQKWTLLTDGAGTWGLRTTEYFTFWVNGFGASTIISSVDTYSSPAPISGIANTVTHGATTYSPTELTLTDTVQMVGFRNGTGPLLHYNGDVLFSIKLSNRYERTTASQFAISLLDAVETPPPDSSIGSSTGKRKISVLWPDTASTQATRTISTDRYMIGAAYGMLTTGAASLDGGTIASKVQVPAFSISGLATPAIVCAKSKWILRNNSFNNAGGKPKAPWDLYYHPLDSSFTAQPIVNLGRRLGYSYFEFDPSTANAFGTHPGSDVPPYGFSAPYNPPYSPSGYGEIGFESTT